MSLGKEEYYMWVQASLYHFGFQDDINYLTMYMKTY